MDGVSRHRQVRAAGVATIAIAACAATEVAYLAVIRSQGGAVSPQPDVVPFVSGYVATIAVATLVGIACLLSGSFAAAKTLFVAAATGSAALGFLAIFSIGLALVIIAALLLVAAASTPILTRPHGWLWPVLCGFIAVVALVAGFFVVGTF
jgi:hypothetical protein